MAAVGFITGHGHRYFARLRRANANRQLNTLPPAHRSVVLGLVGAIALAVLLMALFLLGAGPLDWYASVRQRTAAGVTILGGATLGFAVLAGTLRVAPSLPPGPRVLVAAFLRILPLAGLFAVVISVIAVDRDVVRNYAGTGTWLAMWLSLAVACVYVLRRGNRSPHGVLDPDRATRVVLPAVLLAAVSALPLAFGRQVDVTLQLLTPAILITAIATGPLLFGVLFAGIVGGLQATKDRGERLARAVERHTGVVMLLVIGKLAAIAIVWTLWHFLPHKSADGSALTWSLPSWLAAATAAGIVILLFVINGHIRLSVWDHPAVTRVSGLLVGGAIGVAFGTGFVIAISGVFGPARPFIFLGLGALVTLGFLSRRAQRTRGRTAAYLAAAGIAVATALALTPLSTMAASPPIGKAVTDPLEVVMRAIMLLALIAAAVWLFVSAITRRRFGWLTYAFTVFAWMVVVSVWHSVAPPVQLMNFDLALTVLLGVAAGLYALGIQRAIDGLEIVVAIVVTFFLIEGPMIVAVLPEALQVLPILAVFVGPGIASIWHDARAFEDPDEQRRAMIRLATTTLFYYSLMATALANQNVAAVVNDLEQWALSFLSIPLVLLLVAAREPLRDPDTTKVKAETATRPLTISN